MLSPMMAAAWLPCLGNATAMLSTTSVVRTAERIRLVTSFSFRRHGLSRGALADVGTVAPPPALGRTWICPVRMPPPSATPQPTGEAEATPVQNEIWNTSAVVGWVEVCSTEKRKEWMAGVG